MIVVTEERYIPTAPGYITLQDADGLYYYVHKTLYEQAVVLKDRYSDSIDTLRELIGGNQDFEAVRLFTQYVPTPVNIMGYFLGLLENDITEFVDVVGALDAMSSAVNLRNLIKQPVAIRQTVTFGMSIQNEYGDMWDNFLRSCYLYDEIKAAMHGNFNQPAQSTSTVVQSAQQVEEVESEPMYEGTDEEIFAQVTDDALAMFDEMVGDIDTMLSEAKDKEKDKEEDSKAPIEDIPDSLGGNGLESIARARRKAL